MGPALHNLLLGTSGYKASCEPGK